MRIQDDLYQLKASKQVSRTLAREGYIFVSGDNIRIPDLLRAAYADFRNDWDQLEPDAYLHEGARFRFRRYNYFYLHPENNELQLLPYEPFYQPPEDNSYIGGTYRAFPPLSPATVANLFMRALIWFSFRQMPQANEEKYRASPWKVEVHQVRVVSTANETGDPSPEGIHRDGGESGFVYLMNRDNARGAESLVYDNGSNLLARRALCEPMDAQLFLDPRVLHDVTPLYPVDTDRPAVRDVFILGFAFTPDLKRPVNS